ncbi:MAG: lipoyl(octanoyl) transferase LipB, partial [Chloroflexota bacterium]
GPAGHGVSGPHPLPLSIGDGEGQSRRTAPPSSFSPSPFPLERGQGGEATGGGAVAPARLLRLGLVDYEVAWDLQRRAVAARIAGEIPDLLILLEHPHVYTLGRGGHAGNVLLDDAALARVGARLFWVDRGGDVTYHGPGQLVGYPIVHLARLGKDVHAHLRRIEETLIRALADFGIEGHRDPEYTGVWVGDEKIAAIGVRVSHWVSSHGFALNVNPDLGYFANIIPCGIRHKGVTSLVKLLGRPVSRGEAEIAVVRHFEAVFGVEVEEPSALDARLGELERDVSRANSQG